MRLFYHTPSTRSIECTVNDTLSIVNMLQGGPTVQYMTMEESNVSSIRFAFTETDSLKLYGVSFETPAGIFVDNFSMRGNSGIGFSFISDEMLTAFHALQQYRLIVLQYGLNVVSLTDSTNFTSYEINMVRIIHRLKKLFPETSLLLVGVSDRASNQNGKFLTYPDIPLMRDVQRRIAEKTKITFWDMYEAMGGENSIVKYVDAKPALAAKDYTHLTYWGGRKIAVKLAHAILFERNRHGKSTAH
jgi:lysophospholipase L1-like esterase